MTDARRHGPQRRELASLHQVILGTYKVLLSLLALQHFLFQSTVEAFQVAGPFGHPTFQFASGLGLEGDPLQVMAAPLHHQAEQQHHHQQRGAADGDHGPYRAVDQGARGEDVTFQPVSAIGWVWVSQAFGLSFNGRGSRVG